ncbi:MFS general substrate transporter [Daedalea quercina L-15889]|uniref:MFS general substrate transporter n=1 Tax=Daedalea quercina L-15889 TaxID=1314783 RepID=A0A165Q7A6_9APHY|nr:MFS general substrate transporter [Daedalea quercina L-15889]
MGSAEISTQEASKSTPSVSPLDVQSVPHTDVLVDDSTLSTPRVYKRRWLGLVAIIILNVVAGMPLVWFGPIADSTANEFRFTLDQVNWLGNCINLTYLPCAVAVPMLYTRLGLRRTCFIGGLLLIVAAWVRYAGTTHPLSVSGAYSLVIIGQIISGVVQPIFQVLAPGYSEKWFDLRQRTTATMLMAVANPIGSALGQLISPLVGTPRDSILVLAIISTAVTPLIFLVNDAPPAPPTLAAAQESPSFWSFVRAMAGREPQNLSTYMTLRQRTDFVVLAFVFGVLVASITTFSILSSQDLEPYDYSDEIAGLMGATLLLVGLLATVITAPLFDRILTHHLAWTCKCLCPIIGGAWISLIWAVRRNDTGGLFAIMAIVGASSLTLLPVALELAVELTRNANASCAMLWASSNTCGVVFVLSQGALRASANADPPYNMYRAIIFQGAVATAAAIVIFFMEGKQVRRSADEQAQAQIATMGTHEMDMPKSTEIRDNVSLSVGPT